jgi:hypothetical protein
MTLPIKFRAIFVKHPVDKSAQDQRDPEQLQCHAAGYDFSQIFTPCSSLLL